MPNPNNLTVETTFTQTTTGSTPSFYATMFDGFPKSHTCQVEVASGTATDVIVELLGSLDGTSFFSLSGTQTGAESNIMFHVVNRPVKFVAMNIDTLDGGTNPVITTKYLGIRY